MLQRRNMHVSDVIKTLRRELKCFSHGLRYSSASGCVCTSGWEGNECTEVIPEVCLSHDCGEGHCEEESGAAICMCPSDEFSQESTSAPCTRTCGDVQCANGAHCSSDGTSCLCTPGYTGRESCSEGMTSSIQNLIDLIIKCFDFHL